MRKRLVLVTAVALVLSATLALYVLRVPAVETLARSELGDRGITVQSLEVQRVSLDGLALTNLVLGRNGEFEARAVTVDWQLTGSLGVEVARVRVEGARLDVDLTDEASPFGSLQALFAAERRSGPPPNVPNVQLDDAIVKLRSRAGEYAVGLDGTVDSTASGAPHASMNIVVDGQMGHVAGAVDASVDSLGQIVGTVEITDGTIDVGDATLAGLRGQGAITLADGELLQAKGTLALSQVEVPLDSPLKGALRSAAVTFELDPADMRLQADLRGTDASTVLNLDARARNYRAEPTIALTTTFSANADAQVWSMLNVDAPTQGVVSLNLQGNGRTPRFDGLRDNWLEWLGGVTVKTYGELTAQQLSYAAKLDALHGTLGFKGSFTDGAGEIVVSDGGRISVKQFQPKWLAALGLPGWLAETVADGVRLDVVSGGDAPTKLTLSSDEAGFHGSAHVNATLAGTLIDVEVQATGSATVDKSGEIANFKLRPSSAAIRTGAMSAPGAAKVEQAQLTLAARLAGTPSEWSGKIDAATSARRALIEGVQVENPAIRLPLKITGGTNHWRLSLAEPGSFSPGSIAPIGAARIESSRKWVVSELNVNSVDAFPGLIGLEHTMTLEPGPITVAIKRSGQRALRLDLEPRRITVKGKLDAAGNYHASCVVDARSINLPTAQLAIEGFAATVQCGSKREGPFARFTINSLADSAQPPAFAPVQFDGEINEDSKGYALKAIGRVVDVPRFRLAGRYAPVTGKGSVAFDLTPVALTPGQLQPADLLPVLGSLKRVSGQVGFRGRLAWTDNKVESSATLTLGNLSFDQDAVAVTGFTSTLQLDDLLAMRSRPLQRLSIKRVELGVPFENFDMSYQFEVSGQPRVDIANATVDALGGTMSIGAVSFRADHKADTVLTIKTLDLARLFEALAIEGLTGTGRISGQVPLTFDAANVSIYDGRLAADGKGVLRFTSERAAEFLAGGGEQAQLLLRAVENFHYSELTLAIAKSGQDDLTATLSTLGRNPDVLDGQLFRLNINLESNIRKILDALGQGFQWSNEALRGAFSVR